MFPQESENKFSTHFYVFGVKFKRVTKGRGLVVYKPQIRDSCILFLLQELLFFPFNELITLAVGQQRTRKFMLESGIP